MSEFFLFLFQGNIGYCCDSDFQNPGIAAIDKSKEYYTLECLDSDRVFAQIKVAKKQKLTSIYFWNFGMPSAFDERISPTCILLMLLYSFYTFAHFGMSIAFDVKV